MMTRVGGTPLRAGTGRHLPFPKEVRLFIYFLYITFTLQQIQQRVTPMATRTITTEG